MLQGHPLESLGATMVEEDAGEEYRRVFLADRGYVLDVGEYTCGPQTQRTYGMQTHHHVVQLASRDLIELVEACFKGGEGYLVDLMDELDAKGIPYGYLNTIPGKYVAYRSHRAGMGAVDT